MEEAGQRDRIASAGTSPSAIAFPPGGRPVEPNLTEQPLPRKNERLVSINPTQAAGVTGAPRDVTDQIGSAYTGGTLTPVYPPEQTYFYGGYENSTGNWDDYSRYVSASGMQVVSPAMYNDNSSMLRYGLDNQMAYGQFSPMASPLSPIMVDGQLYSPHQIPMSPNYFAQPVSPGVPHVTSSLPSQTDLVAAGSSGQEGLGDNVLFGHGSGYYLHFGSFGGGGLSGEPLSNISSSESGGYLSQLPSPAAYPQPVGILGPYEQNFGQISQQRPFHGYGSAESSFSRNYRPGSSYQSSNYGTASTTNWGTNYRSRFASDKGGRQERDRESIFVSNDAHGISSDRNRGPRATKPKGKSPTDESSISATSKNVASVSAVRCDLYNQPDFVTDYENAKFFVIKSFSEDNVHKSIKYSVWASTPLGNKKLEIAYAEAKEMKGECPIFLLFSVNASGQFCGVAEMVGPVDFDNDADYWQQDRWSGQFPVRWHIIKDVPNGRFRHILLENNENKPVTHSRDSQEVKLEQGIEMLKIFKDHEAETSILDDFNFYDDREKALQERKARQHASSSTKKEEDAVVDGSIKQLSGNFAGALQLDDGGGKEEPVTK